MKITKSLLAAASLATLLGPPAAHAQTLTSVYQVQGSLDASYPYSALTKLDGKYYGTARYGGQGVYYGVVFSVDLKTGVKTILHSFTGDNDGGYPAGGLTELDGKLYGVTYTGGSAAGGAVFSIDSTGAYTQVSFLPDRTQPNYPLVAYQGTLYGTGADCSTGYRGCVYSFNPATNAAQILYTFGQTHHDGIEPTFLTVHGNTIFGVTEAGGRYGTGTIFNFDPATSHEKILHDFGSGTDGQTPVAPLVFSNGLFYGTASHGGSAKDGIVFSFDPQGEQETILYNFTGKSDGAVPLSPLLDVNGLLYGTTQNGGGSSSIGVVYSIDPATETETIVHGFAPYEGSLSMSGLIAENGLLYGALSGSGPANQGTIFSLDPATSQERTVSIFAGVAQATPSALIQSSGALFGVAMHGGKLGLGSIFKVLPRQQSGALVYSFSGADGVLPNGALLDVNGVLYGATASGGVYGSGTVFGYTPKTHTLRTIYSFKGGKDGARPDGALIQNNGILYGNTISGGTSSFGTVFKIALAGGQKSTLYSFSGSSDGVNSAFGLTFANGALYGTTLFGGTHSFGAIFRVDPESGAETTAYSFQSSASGVYPIGELLLYDGSLYGLTQSAGDVRPTVYRFDPVAGSQTVLHAFEKGAVLSAGLVAAGNKLYAPVQSEEGSENGGVLRINADTGAGSEVFSFPDAQNGTSPRTTLVHVNGAFYGSNFFSTEPEASTILRFKP